MINYIGKRSSPNQLQCRCDFYAARQHAMQQYIINKVAKNNKKKQGAAIRKYLASFKGLATLQQHQLGSDRQA